MKLKCCAEIAGVDTRSQSPPAAHQRPNRSTHRSRVLPIDRRLLGELERDQNIVHAEQDQSAAAAIASQQLERFVGWAAKRAIR